ncbi:MAG: hypothetical protein IPL39_00165 [Opitutaceae bacterium]|nr:hypothetical protein [Opitutaceae bacterium]
MITLRTLLRVAVWLAWPAVLSSAAEPFAGVFKGDGLTFTSRATTGGAYQGSLALDGESYPFEARPEGATLRGVFTTPEGTFDFAASSDGPALTLTTDDARYRLSRQSANPLAAKRAPAAHVPASAVNRPATPAPAAARPTPTRKYIHSSGFSFDYPAGWAADESQAASGILVLRPANTQPQQETYLVSGADAGGITAATDPRVEQLLEQFVAQMAPGFQRTGRSESIAAGEQAGVSLVWEGAGPTGAPMRLRVYTTVLNNALVSLTAVGETPRILAREGQLRAIFTTFDLDKAAATAATGASGGNPVELVGTWKNWKFKSYGGSSSSEKTTFITLAADGSYGVSGNAESSHSFTFRNSGGAETGNAGYASQGGGSEGGGRWQAANGVLTLTDATGSTSFNYQIRSNSSGWPILYATPLGASKASEWTRVR